MSRGIIIFGSAGSEKTTLGNMVAEKLNFPYFDIDDYIWRKDTERPFTLMYSRKEKISRLINDITKYDNFIMADSLPCKVLKISGDEPLEYNLKIIVNEYLKIRKK